MSELIPSDSELKIFEQRGYLVGRKINEGTYCTIHLADYVDNKRKLKLACKIFDKEKSPKDVLKKFFLRELDILTKIKNVNIIQTHSILQRGKRIFIFMKYAPNGNLLDYIKSHGQIGDAQGKIWFKQIINGLQYLHNINIAHRNLKCENLLMSTKFNIKITDFGFARFCTDEHGDILFSQTYCGSTAYAPPEVISGIPYNPKMSDIWTTGIILFIMLNASMPFDDSNMKKLVKDQMNKNWNFRKSITDTLNSRVKHLIRVILEPDPIMRINLNEILRHDWLI